MKTKLKNNKGITLVALIITIIVLLILAMVSIRLVMNGGIIDRAEKGTKAYTESEVQEQIKLAYSEWQTARWTGETRTAADFVKARLETTYGENKVDNVTETNGVFTVKFKDGREYTYNVATGTTEKVGKWNDNGDGSWTHSETGTKVQIGDVVNYNELSNGAKSYTTDATKGIGGSVGTKDSTTGKYPLNSKTYTTEDLTWRVLGVNASGQIELISENPMSDANKVYLANEEGYLYGPSELNTMCNSLYGKGKGAVSARSLNVDDVDKLAGITTDADKKACTSNYGSKWKYRYPTTEEVSGTRYMQYNTDTGSGYSDSWTNITSSTYQTFRMPGEGTTINSTNPGYSPELTFKYYSYSISSEVNKTAKDGTSIANLLAKGTTSSNISQWLASSCVGCYSNSAGFDVHGIKGGSAYTAGDVEGSELFNSNGFCGSSNNRRVRPVVSLESNIQLRGDSTNGWTIQ